MTIPEIIAVITGVLSVWYARKESILVYPVGIISVLLYVYICLEVKLYADAAVNFYYFLASVYGWYFWLKGGKQQEGGADEHAHITQFGFNMQMITAAVTVLVGLMFMYILDNYTDSNVPLWDGITTAIFCTAMWLMARKNITNWIYWIIGDIICVPLFFSKGLCFSSLQYGIFTVLAVAGWFTWYHRLKKRQAEAHA